MEKLLEYKCPCCGGAIGFDSSVQKMKCPYCDTEFETETLREYDEELKRSAGSDMNWESSAGDNWSGEETEHMRSYICNSCGGEILTDETTAATKCPYCDNPVIMTGNLSGTLRPDYVIPFKLSREDAKAALKRHVEKKRLLPKVFKDENHLDEVKGIYVPFWIFDADADARIRYNATRVRSWSDARFHHTETSHFSVVRGGHIGFEHIPVDGSSKMDDTLMESIEPFDFSDAVDFQTAYLAGYLADKYDVTAEKSVERANERVRNSTQAALRQTVTTYATAIPVATDIRLSNGVSKYALYPVWILNTTWKDKKYVFAMNGQTGKLTGDLPLDKAAFFRWLFSISLAVGAAVFALLALVWLM